MTHRTNAPGRAKLLVATLAASMIGSLASAQVLEEVVVTAQKREQSLQDVGISVTAFTGDQIDQLGFTNSTDVAAMSPGVHVSGSSAGQNQQFTVRGVTQNDFLDAIEGPTAIYLDEGYVAQQNGGTFALFDIERVEILKGPQGTLFGRNATGGLVHYVTRKPTEEYEGYVDVTYGDYDLVNVQAAAGGPITDTVRARASVYYNHHDDIIENIFPFQGLTAGPPVTGAQDDHWNDDTLAGRLQLEVDITDDLQLYLMGHGYRINTGEAPYQSSPTIQVYDQPGGPGTDFRLVNVANVQPGETREAIGPQGVNLNYPFEAFGLSAGDIPSAFLAPRPNPGGDRFGYIDPDGADFLTSKDYAFDDSASFDNLGFLGKFTWNTNLGVVTSISDYKKFDRNLTVDVNSSPADDLVFSSITDTSSFTQELRINGETEKTRWVAGFYFLTIDADVTNGFLLNASSLFNNGPLAAGPALPFVGLGTGAGLPAGAPISLPNLIDLDTDSYSFFGQVEYDISEQLTFTAGLRIIQEEKDYELSQLGCLLTDATEHTPDVCPFAFGTSAEDLSGAPYTEDTSDTLWTGKVQLDWRPTDDILLYFGVNRGVKAGAFNAPLALTGLALPARDIGYDEEILLAYEGGFKTTWWDGKLRANGSVYYYDYTDYQAFAFVGVSGIVRNTDATNVGVEFDIQASPLEGLDVLWGISAFDFEVENVAVSPGFVKDVEPAFAPRLTMAGLIRYEWPAFFGGRIAAQMDANYRSKFFHNINNFAANKYPSAYEANARLTYYSEDDRWEVGAFVNNFTDQRNPTIGFDLAGLCGCNENAYVRPQWWGVNVRMNF